MQPLSRRTLLGAGFAAAALPAAPARARQAAPESSAAPAWLEAVARQIRDELKLPAVWLAVSTGGRTDAVAVGVKKIGDPTPATTADRLTVASISKPMAGLWIASLVDAGKLTYDTRVLDVLPELASVCLPEHRDITVGQLLTHTAGVIRDARGVPSGLRLDQYPAERLRQGRVVVSSPAPPGSKGKLVYSNNGVTLAVTVAERAAGEPYETAAGRLYRERLGLSSWGVWPMTLADDLTTPWPHRLRDGVFVAQTPRSVAGHFVRPSGGAHCTIGDLARFGLLATNSRGAGSDTALLRPTTWETILRRGPRGGDRTLGSFAAEGREFGVYEHGGSLTVTRSFLRVLPEWGTSFALHTNAQSEAFRDRGGEILEDALRKRRAEQDGARSCRLALTEVSTVDGSWQNVVTPRAGDPTVRVRVRFAVAPTRRTDDLQVAVRLGDVWRRADFYGGLRVGTHTLRFAFDTPKTGEAPLLVVLDALGTAGNRTPEAARQVSVLRLGA